MNSRMSINRGFVMFPLLSRRQMLSRLGGGFGSMALAALLGDKARAETARFDLAPKQPPYPAKAKAVIQLFMHGGPSHVDLFDPKPMLTKFDGTAPPKEVADDEKITDNLLKSPFRFNQCGQSGIELSETLQQIARHADDIAVIRPMFTMHRNHEQACW